MAIFSDFIGESMEVFIDDFSVFGPSFDACLEHLTQILDVYVKKCLVLSWEKYHFMVREGILLGHLVLSKGFEVDKAKVEVIQDLALPNLEVSYGMSAFIVALFRILLKFQNH